MDETEKGQLIGVWRKNDLETLGASLPTPLTSTGCPEASPENYRISQSAGETHHTKLQIL